ncbi:unnamed protein product [Spirodela intermedia]|uniref:RING-type E3 ubiquitin transferase n=2 Tax=Spirodela intermedia TaxID=51605 RepID=A0A7I8LIF4_SPIIN|nr:unnamed protein product [Spirodela intermedia]CAA6672556.1 unnamed protein product [Spirodela intermedia]CAA7409819.1 unnamed protein product [Spirodela intermedia]
MESSWGWMHSRMEESTLIDEVVILDDRSAAPRGAADLIRWRSHLLPGMGPSEGEQQTAVLSSGLNEEMALLLLRTRRYVPSSTAYASDETCCICQEDYDEGEDVGMLSCGHGFHAACVGRWLTQRNVCPICRRTGLQPAV